MGKLGISLINKISKIDTRRIIDKDDLTFMPRALVMATLPHSNPGNQILAWERFAGNFRLLVRADPKFGMPYGSYPRLFAMWLTNEILRTKKRVLSLEGSYYAFLSALKLHTDGKTRRRFKGQVNALLASAITLDRIDSGRFHREPVNISDTFDLWWDPKRPADETLWQTSITLNEVFYNHVINHAVPLDIRIVNSLKKSPLALDLYAWMSYRYFYLKKETQISWSSLFHQFGADYDRVLDFKKRLKTYLIAVHTAYPDARFELVDRGLILKPSRTSIPPKFLKLS